MKFIFWSSASWGFLHFPGRIQSASGGTGMCHKFCCEYGPAEMYTNSEIASPQHPTRQERKWNVFAVFCWSKRTEQELKEIWIPSGEENLFQKETLVQINPRNTVCVLLQEPFLGQFLNPACPFLAVIHQSFPFIAPAVSAFAALHAWLLCTCFASSIWKAGWERKPFIIKECCDK